jgi:hypothetical protein
LPDALLDPILDDATQAIVDFDPHWPWLRERWAVTVTADATLGIALDAEVGEILVASPDTPTGLSVYEFIDHDTALRRDWRGDSFPRYWSTMNGRLYLWPVPTADTVVNLDGYRSMAGSWTSGGAGAEPDCPEAFHSLVRTYGLRGAYLQQDDPETASIYAQEFNNGLATRAAAYTRAPAAQPFVVGGGVTPPPTRNPSVWRDLP